MSWERKPRTSAERFNRGERTGEKRRKKEKGRERRSVEKGRKKEGIKNGRIRFFK